MNDKKVVISTSITVLGIGLLLPIAFTYHIGFIDILLNSENQINRCPSYQALVREKVVTDDKCYAYLHIMKLDKFHLTKFNCSDKLNQVIEVYPISCGFSGQNFNDFSVTPTFSVNTHFDKIIFLIMISMMIMFWFVLVMLIFGTSFGIIQEHQSVNSGSIKKPRNIIHVSN